MSETETHIQGTMVCPKCKELSCNLYFDADDIESGVTIRCEKCLFSSQPLPVETKWRKP